MGLKGHTVADCDSFHTQMSIIPSIYHLHISGIVLGVSKALLNSVSP